MVYRLETLAHTGSERRINVHSLLSIQYKTYINVYQRN